MEPIIVPARFALESAVQFANKIATLPPEPQYHFDFSGLGWIPPFGMLFTAQALKNLRIRYPNSELVCVDLNSERSTHYAAHMAFFKACGFSLGNSPNFKPTSNTHIPITYVNANQLTSRKAIEEISDELAKQLTQETSGPLVDALTYSFREMIRNVIEHSESKNLAYCAQYWPTKNSVEVAILDTGVGLHHSLAHNPHLTLNTDQDAIKYALMPGISGKTYEGIRIRQDDVWQNSGYGLYMNYRLCNEGGSFFICSGSKGLYRTKDNDNKYYETSFQGTALRLRLNTKSIQNIVTMLKQFGDEGEVIARRVGLGAIPNASTMSRMLKDNFKVDFQISVGDTVKHKKFGEGTVTEKLISPHGEMVWVAFNGGRKKKVLSADVVVINEDTHTYYSDEIEVYEIPDDPAYQELDDFQENYPDNDTDNSHDS